MDSLTHAVRPQGPRTGGVGSWRGPYTSFTIHPFSPPPQGQRPCDLADEEVLSLLEELAQKQEDVSLGPPPLLSAPGRPGREGFLSPHSLTPRCPLPRDVLLPTRD